MSALLLTLAPYVFPLAAALAGWLFWRRQSPLPRRRFWAGAILFGSAAFDGAAMTALPRLGLSFGPVGTSLFCLSAVRLAIALALHLAVRLWPSRPPSAAGLRTGLALLVVLNLAFSLAAIDAFYIEPFALQTTTVGLPGPSGANGAPIRILQISDLHVERITRRERELLRRAEALQPDLILLTGDYPNIDYTRDALTLQDTRLVLSQLHAPYGVYAVPGTSGVDTPEALEAIFDGLENVTLLRNEIRTVAVSGRSLAIVGVKVERERDADTLKALMRQVPDGAYPILLYHTPDLVETAAQTGVRLYLAGHTHGGQARLPFWGAIVTSSRFGKQYESGRYTAGPTTLYVSRGLGLEGLYLPRFRFLCPPEIVLIELGDESHDGL